MTMLLLVAVPSPLAWLRMLPVFSVLRPPYICMALPAPLRPLPTDTTTVPARPVGAVPVPMKTLPVMPPLLGPVLPNLMQRRS